MKQVIDRVKGTTGPYWRPYDVRKCKMWYKVTRVEKLVKKKKVCAKENSRMPTALINNMHTINLRGVLTCHRTAVGQVCLFCADWQEWFPQALSTEVGLDKKNEPCCLCSAEWSRCNGLSMTDCSLFKPSVPQRLKRPRILANFSISLLILLASLAAK